MSPGRLRLLLAALRPLDHDCPRRMRIEWRALRGLERHGFDLGAAVVKGRAVMLRLALDCTEEPRR